MEAPKTTENAKAVCPESTLDSAARRGFIRNAALATAAVGIGTTILGKAVTLPESSASAALCTPTYCSVKVDDSVWVDLSNLNNGTTLHKGGVIFGCYPSCGGAGEGIASARACGSPNHWGLDFYTGQNKRMSITNCGRVGIGTTSPGAALEVVGSICAATQSCCGIAVKGSSLLGTGVEGIGSRLEYGKGVKGIVGNCSFGGRGVCGTNQGICGYGVYGCGGGLGTGVYGQTSAFCCSRFERYGVYGLSPYTAGVAGSGGTGVLGLGSTKCSVPLISRGVSAQNAALQKWQVACSCPCGAPITLDVVSSSGWLGIGTSNPSSAICVVGNIAASRLVLANQGVIGNSTVCNGVTGTATSGHGVVGETTSGIGVKAMSGGSDGIPLVAQGAAGQIANLQQWQKGCTAKSIMNNCGWLGLGATSAPTTLTVGGSVSAKTVVATANYKMGASDFAVLASGTITVTLPPASTAAGMIVFIKNTSTSTVTVKAYNKSGVETDTIEGSASKHLKKQYDSLQLISNGTNEWFVLAGSVCGAFTS